MNTHSITVLIVDDEPFARKYIREMLKDQPGIEIVGEAGNGIAALHVIEEMDPDLIFLDIQMPEMDGFALLENLIRKDLPVIIFTTAYEEYAIRAFEVNALDYLLKPFDQPRFAQTLERARVLFREKTLRHQESRQITELLRTVSQNPRFLDRLLIKKDGRIVFQKIKEIDWIKADDKYIHLRGENVRHMIRQTLCSIRSQLDPSQFVQVNRSVLVNIESIKELHAMFNGDHEVQVNDGTKFTLSRVHKKELFDLLGKPLS